LQKIRRPRTTRRRAPPRVVTRRRAPNFDTDTTPRGDERRPTTAATRRDLTARPRGATKRDMLTRGDVR
jgi:hypothetical protein